MEKRNFIIEFIRLYSSLPALWDVNSNEYKDKNVKNEQYDILLKKFNEKYPDAGRRELAQKINSLRTNYRKELKRMKSAENNVAGGKKERESNLYYFDEMSFLRRNEEPCTSRTSKLNEFENETAKRKKRNNSDDLIALATKHLQQGQSRYEKLAEAWAVQLEEIDPQQRIFAEKFINDILFEGKMGTLHRDAISFNTNHTNTALTNSKSPPLSSVSESCMTNNKQSITEIKEEYIQDDIDISERKISCEFYRCEKTESNEYSQPS